MPHPETRTTAELVDYVGRKLQEILKSFIGPGLGTPESDLRAARVVANELQKAADEGKLEGYSVEVHTLSDEDLNRVQQVQNLFVGHGLYYNPEVTANSISVRTFLEVYDAGHLKAWILEDGPDYYGIGRPSVAKIMVTGTLVPPFPLKKIDIDLSVDLEDEEVIDNTVPAAQPVTDLFLEAIQAKVAEEMRKSEDRRTLAPLNKPGQGLFRQEQLTIEPYRMPDLEIFSMEPKPFISLAEFQKISRRQMFKALGLPPSMAMEPSTGCKVESSKCSICDKPSDPGCIHVDPFIRSKEDDNDLMVWLWYHRTCDEYDRQVCGNPKGLPTNGTQRAKISKYARMARKAAAQLCFRDDKELHIVAARLAEDPRLLEMGPDELDAGPYPGYRRIFDRAMEQLHHFTAKGITFPQVQQF